MGYSKMEKLNDAVRAVLKTLECSICLELLKSPVSAKCGHFFCKDCISSVLNSNYRAPCPLCKRSFTRRGIQEATQRDSIICAAKKIAKSCQKLTGFTFFLKENPQDSSSQCVPKCVEESPGLDSSEKIKISFLKTDVNTKKRKSSEKDLVSEDISDECAQDIVLNPADDDTPPSAKKVHFQPESVEEFPSLENLLEESVLSAENDVDISEEKEKEAVPVTLPKKEDGILKKYSKTKYYSKTSENLFKMLTFSSDDEKSKSLEETTSKENAFPNIIEPKANACSPKKQAKNIVLQRKLKSNLKDLKLKDRTNIKTAIKALRNKTDKVDLLTMKDVIKVNDSNGTQQLTTSVVKENENSILFQNMSSTQTALSAKRKGRPKKIRKESSTEEGILNQVPKGKEVSCHNKMDIDNAETNSLQKECYNLNEISISNSSILDHDQMKKSNLNVKVLLQDICLPDTAVSVDSITSPPANKSVSLYKSPGWSRVKQDGKDFRVKTFSALDVAKNSPGLISNDVSDCAENESAKCTKPKFVQISHALRSEVSPKELDKHPSSKKKKEQSVCETIANKQMENNCCAETHSESEKHSVDASESLECCEASQLRKSILDCPDEYDEQYVHSNQSVPTNMQCSVKLIKMKLDSQTKSDEMCEESLAHDLNCSRIVSETPFILPHSKADEKSNEAEISSTKKVFNELIIQETENMNLNPNESQEQFVNNESNLHKEHSQKVTELVLPLKEKNDTDLMPTLEKMDNVKSNELMQMNDAEVDLLDDLKFSKSIPTIIGNKAPNQHPDPIVGTGFQTFSSKNDVSVLPTSEQGLTETREIALSNSFASKPNDDIIFLDHSQQTSQSFFNHNVDKTFYMCNAVTQKTFLNYSEKKYRSTDFKYPALPNKIPCIYTVTNVHDVNPVPKAEKTKVLKRTCLTFEEIQDSFLKSSLSGQAETISSIPFLGGEFKLNISVAEETLNVSVVKVIDEASENGSLSAKKLILEKGVQTSAGESPTSSQASFIPSSNAESETSLLDVSDKIVLERDTEPFPYLSQKSLENNCANLFSMTAPKAEKVDEVTESNFCGSAPGDIPLTEKCAETELNDSKPDCLQHDDYSDLNATMMDITEQQDLDEMHLNNKTGETNSRDNVSTENNIQNNESDKCIDENVQKSPTLHKNKSNLEKCTSEEKLNNSGDSSEEFDPFEGNLETFRIPASVQISDDSDNFSSDPDMAYASKLVAPLKNLAKKKRMLEKKGISPNAGSHLTSKSESSNAKLAAFSKENSIMDSNAATCKKQSRLSLKSKSSHKKFKRIQSCESSDESESDEMSLKDHSVKKDLSNVQAKSFQSPKSSLANIEQSLPKKSLADSTSDVRNQQDAVEALLTAPNETVDEHCTLNSVLSDEIKDADANQIVMEIEDLDSKIKMLEAKLKLCGHAETLKQNSNPNKSKESNLTHKDENNAVDDEDSTDLFTESIPPTPPEALS